MKHINYFKSEAKKLLKDLKTRTFEQIEGEEFGVYNYPNTKFFDVNAITSVYDFDESREPTLMSAQHMIAVMAGFKSWDDLIKAPPKTREMLALIFENQNIFSLEDWIMYAESTIEQFYPNRQDFDIDLQMAIYKAMVEEANGQQIGGCDGFKLNK